MNPFSVEIVRFNDGISIPLSILQACSNLTRCDDYYFGALGASVEYLGILL